MQRLVMRALTYMKPILFACLLILVFASCTGRRYGHYGYVKKGEKKDISEINKKNLLPVMTLAVKLPESMKVAMQVDTIPARALSPVHKTAIITVKHRINKLLPGTNYKHKKTNAAVNKNPDEKTNGLGKISFILALLAVLSLIIALISGIFVILALLLSIFSIFTGSIALEEIEAGKGKGRKLTLAGLYISSVIAGFFALVVILALLLIVLMLLFWILVV